MMRCFTALVLIVTLSVAGPAFAGNQSTTKATRTLAKRSVKARPQEPDGFLGLKFGVPLASQLPECPNRVYGEESPKPECVNGFETRIVGNQVAIAVVTVCPP